MILDEKQLLQEVLQGNATAYKDVYRLYYNDLCRYTRKYFPVREDAEEIVQDTLVRIWENRDRLTHINNLRTYLFTSVKNSCLNRIEHLRVVQKHADTVALEIKALELGADDDYYENQSLVEREILKAIEDLPEQCGKVFKMKYIDGMKAKDIADEVNLSQRTVETHVFNGLKQLRQRLGHLFPVIVLGIVVNWIFIQFNPIFFK